jgi:hypothetical protein
LTKFFQAHRTGKAFAGEILDLTVPGNMGGKGTMARLLEINPGIKGSAGLLRNLTCLIKSSPQFFRC